MTHYRLARGRFWVMVTVLAGLVVVAASATPCGSRAGHWPMAEQDERRSELNG